ncbi:hypothetical protein SLEP1_g15440 [Rubroshorea leprosula]|uniref:Uncharacterized protein n=1 Tax=Rubroshorea leprosula TaxID=152421 RepID=A0AAV5IWJ0_9ROSI|nr:hypothetical protein SLEP1_g15440 [Rubroshorea leprosula]
MQSNEPRKSRSFMKKFVKSYNVKPLGIRLIMTSTERRADGPFQIMEKINANNYEIKLLALAPICSNNQAPFIVAVAEQGWGASFWTLTVSGRDRWKITTFKHHVPVGQSSRAFPLTITSLKFADLRAVTGSTMSLVTPVSLHGLRSSWIQGKYDGHI